MLLRLLRSMSLCSILGVNYHDVYNFFEMVNEETEISIYISICLSVSATSISIVIVQSINEF